MFYLNKAGNPLGVSGNADRLPMHPFFTLKDLVTITGLLLITAFLISYAPNALGHGWPLFCDTLTSNCAISWNNMEYNFTTLSISMIYLNHRNKSHNVKFLPYKGNCIKSADNQILINRKCLSSLVGISETTRTHNNNYSDFDHWLAGLIDGDGYFNIVEGKYVGCEITVESKDIKLLQVIKDTLGGSIKPRGGANALRWRTYNRNIMIDLVTRVNGLVRNSKRLVQLHKVCQVLDIPVRPIVTLDSTSSWFAGMFDADGTINYYKQFNPSLRLQLTISVTGKYLPDIQPFQDVFGGAIYYDSAQNGYYKWSINSREMHLKLQNYFSTALSYSIKSKRIPLISKFYELYELKAHVAGKGTTLSNAFNNFEKEWMR